MSASRSPTPTEAARTTVRAGRVAAVVLAAACASDSGPTDPPPSSGPAVVEVSPSSATLDVGATRQLTAVVRDAGGRSLDVGVVWSSDAAAVASVGSAGLVTARAPGAALVKAVAGTAQGSSTITVRNAAPTVVITAPSDGAVFPPGSAVQMTGSATDPEDGTLPDSALVWSSNRHGELGRGGSLRRDDLANGDHVLVLRATDAHGASASDTVRISLADTATNRPPSATIATPASGATFTVGDTVRFTGSGTDPEDGTLADAALSWASSLDGALGTGRSLVRADLSAGSHRVTLTATDSDGATATDTVTVTVRERAAVATVELQPDVAVLDVGGTPTTPFAATARDANGNVVSAELTWSSGAPAVASVDAAGTVRGHSAGHADVVVAAEAARDTARVLVVPSGSLVGTALAAGAWSRTVQAGDLVSVEVRLDMTRASASGDLGSAQFDLTYDATFLEVQSAAVASPFTGQANADQAGVVRVAVVSLAARGQPSFPLGTVTFRVRSGVAAGAASQLGLTFTEAPTSTTFAAYPLPRVIAARLRAR